MTDKEILLSLSNMLEPIRSDISEIKEDVSVLKEDVSVLKEDVSGLNEEVSSLKSDMSEVKSRLKKVELTQEVEILPRLRTIEACYTSTYDRYKTNVDGYDKLREDMDVMQKVVTEHSEKLKMIS